MCTLTYYLRPLKNIDGRAQGSLCIRLIYRRKARSLSLGIRLYEDEWDPGSQKIINSSIFTQRTAYLSHAEAIVEACDNLFKRILLGFEEQGGYTVDDVVTSYRNHTTPGNLNAYCQKQVNVLRKHGRERTARAYLSAVRSITTFNNGKSLTLKDIDVNLLREYERYLKERGKTLNTISFYMRNLRALYNKSVADNVISGRFRNPFSEVYTGINRTRKRALSLKEAISLRDLDLSSKKNRRLERARRLFFFCFYARGMSFINMAYLRKDNIRRGVISYYRKKTGRPIEVKITPVLRELIDGFANETRRSSYLFPILNEKVDDARLQYENALRLQNKHLKELAKLAGLSKPVSSHVARHSWATIAKHEDLPLSVISECLGHSNEKTTYIYLASFERSRLDDANELIGNTIQWNSRGNHNYSRG